MLIDWKIITRQPGTEHLSQFKCGDWTGFRPAAPPGGEGRLLQTLTCHSRQVFVTERRLSAHGQLEMDDDDDGLDFLIDQSWQWAKG